MCKKASTKFTGKELDPETGLYFYGARYYDSKLSRWISADPPLATGEYLPNGNKKHDANLPGMGGVFNSINLNGYQYCGQNPVKFVDPDGRYSRSIAVMYAITWSFLKEINSLYPDFEKKGGNCTNFVSQCLYAGGLKMNQEWFVKMNGGILIDKSPSWSSPDY